MSDEQREVYEVTLPISDVTADVIGMPAEWFERAVRRCGRLTTLRNVTLPAPEPWPTPRDFDSE